MQTSTFFRAAANSAVRTRRLFSALIGFVIAAGSSSAQQVNSPTIYVNDSRGAVTRVDDSALYTFERKALRIMAAEDGPDEMLVLATSASADFFLDLQGERDQIREILIVSLNGAQGELQWLDDYGKKRNPRQLSPEQVESIRSFVSVNMVDRFAPLESTRIVSGKEEQVVGGTAHVYLHLDSKAGRRVYINNPPLPEDDYPPDERFWKYSKIVDFFRDLRPADGVPETE